MNTVILAEIPGGAVLTVILVGILLFALIVGLAAAASPFIIIGGIIAIGLGAI